MSILRTRPSDLRLAFVVEGSHVPQNRTGTDLLEQLWRQEIPRATGCVRPDRVFGIHKGSIAAMRLKKVALRRTTSIAEPLDDILERLRKSHQIDCFVVVWDLVPPWDRAAATCRWNETLGLFEGLSLSKSLDEPFRHYAATRFQEMSNRNSPRNRPRLPTIVRGAILAVCVDPLFESIFMNETAMRQSLGIRGTRVDRWPAKWEAWDRNASNVVASAVDAARGAAPNRPVFRGIRQVYDTLKSEWGVHFLQSGYFDTELRRHPLAKRLAEFRRPTR